MSSAGPDSTTHQLHHAVLETLYRESRAELGDQSPEVLLSEILAENWRTLTLRSWEDNKSRREEPAADDALRAYDALRAHLIADLTLLDWSHTAIWRNIPEVPLRRPWRWLAPILLSVLWVTAGALRFIYRHGMIVGVE